ncbi:MAG: hypothetical protein AB7O45_04935 [Alphaproteobacteria bacterium]
MDQSVALPETAGDLTGGERLLLWSFRAWVSGRHMHQLVWREYARLFAPEDARPALRALELAIGAIAAHARREIVHHPVCCMRIAADERAVMAIFAAAQAEETATAIRHAAWLVRPAGIGPLVAATSALALAMIENDLVLPCRSRRAGPGAGLVPSCAAAVRGRSP